MKIAICGSHSVGKTTLAVNLSKQLGLPLINEIVREVAALHGFSNTQEIVAAPKHQQMRFQQSAIEAQLRKETALTTGFVSDRSLIDFIAYNFFYGFPLSFQTSVLNLLVPPLGYDLLVYCPIPEDSTPTEDGFRLTDNDSQAIIDDNILVLLTMVNCPILYLPPNREEWFDKCLAACEEVQDDE